ncbi:MAG: biotin/lipoyl-binding protein, partial [Pseudomonas sp.]
MLRRRMLIMLGVVVLLVLILGGYKAFSIYQQVQMFSAPKPPISVAATESSERAWQNRLPAVGSLTAFQGVDLSLETAGTVKALQFESGQKVSKGQPLLQLDSDVETALLGTAMADLGLAQVDFNRGSQLVGSQAISRGEYDRLSAQY